MDERNSEDYQIGQSHKPSPIWQSEEFFSSNYFQIGQHVVLLRVNFTVQYIIIIIITVLNTNFDKPQCVYSKFKATISITTITIIIRLQELNLTN